VLHCSQQFPEQPGRFGLEGGGRPEAHLDLCGRDGEVVVEVADQGGDALGRGIAEVRVAAEMVGDDLGRALGADLGWLEELLRWQAKPGHDAAEAGQVGQVTLFDAGQRVERYVALGGCGAQAQAALFWAPANSRCIRRGG
jgi:hypothetical protein